MDWRRNEAEAILAATEKAIRSEAGGSLETEERAAIQKAEASSGRVTLQYRQDKGRWYSCSPSEYYVTALVAP